MENRQELLKILELSQALRKYYHDALWEEERHFTWWVSIVFPFLVFIYSQSQLDAWQKVTMITVGSLLGIFLAFTGYLVVRREGIYFSDALETFCRTSAALGLHEPSEPVSDPQREFALMPEYPVSESFEKAREKANKSCTRLLLSVFRPKTLGVRDCFQLVFIVSGVLFFAISIITWFTLWGQL